MTHRFRIGLMKGALATAAAMVFTLGLSSCSDDSGGNSNTNGQPSETCVSDVPCVENEDCASLAGYHCNHALTPPKCAKLYCEKNGGPCSGDDFCESGLCWTDGINSTDGICTSTTWVDPGSGLEWERSTADTDMDSESAKSYCAQKGNGWRLPSIAELRSLIRNCPNTQHGGTCGVTPGCVNTACAATCGGCESDYESYHLPPEMHFMGNPGFLLSSTEVADGEPGGVWGVEFPTAEITSGWAGDVACVRDAQ